MTSMFVHLHVHSHYSLLDGLPKIPELVSRAKQLELPALALTDHGALYGAIEFYKECRATGLKPIIGLEAYVAPHQLQFKRPRIDDKNYHLTLLAKNLTGYKNLIILTTIAHLDGFYYKPRFDQATLFKYSQGLICLSGCPKGELRQALQQQGYAAAKKIAQTYREVFKEDYYLEVQQIDSTDKNFIQQQQADLSELIKLSSEAGVPLAATHDVHYLTRSDAEAQDILVATRLGQAVDDPKRFTMQDMDLSLLPPRLMRERFANCESAIDNTVTIADSVELELDLTTWHYPKFKVPAQKSASDYLRELVTTGLRDRFDKITDEMQERLDYELDIINHKKYASYFLIVADFMHWARAQGVLTTSRGSVSGSLVSYCLGITNVDPLRYDLPFERFLTKHRVSPPDMDVDIADDRRDEVIAYVKQRYGHNKVAQICTFGKMLPRAAVRDVTRALGLPYALGDRVAKLIPFGAQGFPVTIENSKQKNPELNSAYGQEPEVKRILDLAAKLEGCNRHVSVHAAGVVITPDKLTDFVPLQLEPKGKNIITQYDMYALDPNVSKESVGLLKMDFLGLRNLAVLGRCVEIIKAVKEQDVDVNNLPLDDNKTFEMLTKGQTFGVFQMAGSGLTAYLKELKPTRVEHLMAMVALYRPGPMETIPEYIRRKHNPGLVKYLDPRLKPILKQSYGTLTYQDDVLMIAIELAGYNWQEADTLRKAIAKKIPSLMAMQRAKFIKGCQDNGLSETKASDLWRLIEPFAAYGFNKAHAASYGMLAYQTAYMKANWPAEFMTALLSAEAGNTDKVAEAVRECARLGIKVLPPDVNKSRADFTYINDRQIRFGLSAIKNLGSDIVTQTIREVKTQGPFKTLEAFLKRVSTRNLNKKSLEALIKSGALDGLGERAQLLHNIEILCRFIRQQLAGATKQQASLFGSLVSSSPTLKLQPIEPAEASQKSAWEREILGLYVTQHPLQDFHVSSDLGLSQINQLNHQASRESWLVLGIVNTIKKILTKKGHEPMLFVQIEDQTGSLEAIVFPSVLAAHPNIWQEGALLILRGRLSERDGESKLLVQAARQTDRSSLKQSIQELKALRLKSQAKPRPSNNGALGARIVIKLPGRSNMELTRELQEVLTAHPGQTQVILQLADNGTLKKIVTRYKIKLDDMIKSEIEELVGPDAVIII